MLLVNASAGSGTPPLVVQPNMRGACATGRVVARPYNTRVPAKSAWLPAERTDVRITAFMYDPAAVEPISLNTIVKGEVVVVLLDKLG